MVWLYYVGSPGLINQTIVSLLTAWNFQGGIIVPPWKFQAESRLDYYSKINVYIVSGNLTVRLIAYNSCYITSIMRVQLRTDI